MPASATYSANPVLALEIDRTGSAAKKTMRLDRDSQLTNSLLQALHPGIRVATVDVPAEPLDHCEQAIVEQALTRIEVDALHRGYPLIDKAFRLRLIRDTDHVRRDLLGRATIVDSGLPPGGNRTLLKRRR